MKTRKQRNSKNKTAAVGDSSTDSGSEIEIAQRGKRRALKSKENVTNNAPCRERIGDTYDADDEPSSANDNERSDTPQLRPNDKLLNADVYNYFSEDEDEVENPPHKKTSSQRRRSLRTPTRIAAQLESAVPAVALFKMPALISKPTPSLYSSLKKDTKGCDSPGVRLRVSFSDESINEPNSLREYRKSVQTKVSSVDIDTSTPAISRYQSITGESPNRSMRVVLPRLSDIASPIYRDCSVSLKRRWDSHPSNSQSSGYESMIVSASAEAIGSSATQVSEPSHKRPRRSVKSVLPTESPPSPTPIKLSVRKQRKIAIERLKEKEQRYLAEMEELEDFDLCIE